MGLLLLKTNYFWKDSWELPELNVQGVRFIVCLCLISSEETFLASMKTENIYWMQLFSRKVPGNKTLFSGTVPENN